MSTNDDTPQVKMVTVTRYDVNLSLEDILTPLTQTAASLTQAQAAPGVAPAPAMDPTMVQQLQRLSDLASQLKDVVTQINAGRRDASWLPKASDASARAAT